MQTSGHQQERRDLIARLGRRDWNFPNEMGGGDLFALHPYPAKFIPQIPRALIQEIGVADGGAVCDPFCGSGTTLIEAQSLGFESVGVDLNPIACLISRVATTPQPRNLPAAARRCLELAQTITNPRIEDIPNLDHWFKKPVQRAIAAVVDAIENESSPQTRDILRLALSSGIVRVSNQDSDTRYAAVDRNVSASDVYCLFEKACARYVASLPPADADIPAARVHCRDVLDLTKADLGENIGLVVCSPPYPNAYEYWLYHKYRMWWLGFDPFYVKEREIGARPHYFKKDPHTPAHFRHQMAKVFALLRSACIDNSYVCFVLGDSKIHGSIINNTDLLQDAAASHKFEMVATISRDVALTRKAFNLSNSRITREKVVIFQKRRSKPKPPTTAATLSWHPYKYFPYEKRFAFRELAGLPGIRQLTLTPDHVSVALTRNAVKRLKRLVYFSEYTISDGTHGRTLQAKLENGSMKNGSQKRQATRYGVHGLHEYKGKFNPQVVRGILNAYQLKPWANILDPFCGSGTTLIESTIAGFRAGGWDMNPFAVFLANAKLAALGAKPGVLREIAYKVLATFDMGNCEPLARPSSSAEYLEQWFPADNLHTMETLRAIILRDAGELAPFFLVVLSDLLREYSLQEPSDLRIRRRKSAMPSTPLRERLEAELMKRIDVLQAGFDAHGPLKVRASAVVADARHWNAVHEQGIAQASFDFALTSPPYATALPYIDTQRLSLVWLELLDPLAIRHAEEALVGSREASKAELASLARGLNRNDANLPEDIVDYCRLLLTHVSEKDGFRRKAVPALLYRYFCDMLKTFATVRQAVKPDGLYALVVGTNRTTLGGTQLQIDTPRHLARLGEHAGWSVLELLPLETYKRYGLHAANAVQDETLVVLKRE
jgi:site-specific DNA-methyltransferase (cytosine-N4-specific)